MVKFKAGDLITDGHTVVLIRDVEFIVDYYVSYTTQIIGMNDSFWWDCYQTDIFYVLVTDIFREE